MEQHHESHVKKQLAYTADQWRQTEDEANQEEVLQSITDYTKVFFGRLRQRESVPYKANYGSRLIAHGSSDVKSGDDWETDSGDERLDENPSVTTKTGGSRQRSKPHPYNPSISSEQKTDKLDSVIRIGQGKMKLEDVVQVFDENVVRSGKPLFLICREKSLQASQRPACFALI